MLINNNHTNSYKIRQKTPLFWGVFDIGGESGIRTHACVTTQTDFESAPL